MRHVWLEPASGVGELLAGVRQGACQHPSHGRLQQGVWRGPATLPVQLQGILHLD